MQFGASPEQAEQAGTGRISHADPANMHGRDGCRLNLNPQMFFFLQIVGELDVGRTGQAKDSDNIRRCMSQDKRVIACKTSFSRFLTQSSLLASSTCAARSRRFAMDVQYCQ